MVFPRKDNDAYGGIKVKKAYASIWVLLKDKEIITEGGFDSFPYHTARWTKLAGETYGRSPAMTCLPDIRMVNMMSKTIIKAVQLVC